jgi:hypothetical protein
MNGLIILCSVLSVAGAAEAGDFVLASPERCATVLLAPGEPECVALAADDLVSDAKRITGRSLEIVGADARELAVTRPAVLLATMAEPASAAWIERLAPEVAAAIRGKWEAYRVRLIRPEHDADAPPIVLVAGSDERGTMFGLYAFIEHYLEVDPMHFWADRPPMRRPWLAWDSVDLASDGPTTRYRGWFINDEDLLTEWHLDGGHRDIRYPYYDRVTSPRVSARVFEAMLRLRMNLVIPASFVDIRNPDERRLIDDATRRGLLVSQHHIEPLGVSGFGYQNFWRDRGEDAPYSFIEHPEKFETVWRHYAKRWAKYGDRVVWQLGLRGIADQPVWAADPKAPKTAAARGRMISDAMHLQAEIVRSVDRRENPPMTTTLWMEGAGLHEAGHLSFPPGVIVVFADNSPGWEMQRDFYEIERQNDRRYGIYYHQALWGSGPHLVQGLSPHKIHSIFSQARQRDSDDYVIMNVSNVREFALGVDAASRMLWDFDGYDPDRHLADWCGRRFGPAARQAEHGYRRLFESFVGDAEQNERRWMDGEILHLGERVTRLLGQRLAEGQPLVNHPERVREKLARIERQLADVLAAGREADEVLARLEGADRRFFEANFVAQQQILVGLLEWTGHTLRAALALAEKGTDEAVEELQAALAAMERIARAQALATRGRWQHWYRGDKKMNLPRAREMTEKLLADLKAE